MPYPAGNYQEEMCVLFVALTRSKDTLRLAYGKEAWTGQKFMLPPQPDQQPSPDWNEQGTLPFDPHLDLDQDGSFSSTDEADAPLSFSLQPLAAEEIDRPFTDLPAYPAHAKVPNRSPDSRTPEPPTHPAAIPRNAQTPQNPPPSPQAGPPQPFPPAAQRARSSAPTRPQPSSRPPAAARPVPPRAPVQQTAEQRIGQLMIDGLRSLEASNTLPTPSRSALDQAHDVGVQLRRQEQSTTLDDPRLTPLYHGQHAISVSELRLTLDTLKSEPRIALREWAETSLVLLRTCNTRFVNIDECTLRDVERTALQARISIPLLGPQAPKTIPVIVFDGNYGRVKAGKLTRDALKVRTVTVNGHAHRFDPRTGELLGTPFTPFAIPVSAPTHTDSVQFPYIQKSTGCTSISRNAYCSYSLWSD